MKVGWLARWSTSITTVMSTRVIRQQYSALAQLAFQDDDVENTVGAFNFYSEDNVSPDI